MRPDSPPRSGMERRSLALPMRLEARDAESATLPAIVGHGAVFDSWTDIGGMFRECVRPGAFDAAIREGQDVRALFNHDENRILGRTLSGTLRLSVDATGLAYECDPADTSYARDLVALMRRGDVTQSSFAFRVRPGGAVWTILEGEGPDGSDVWQRELTDLDLFDVSPVVYPAYPDADSGLRSADFGHALRSLREEQERRGKHRPDRDAHRSRRLRLALANR